MELSPETTINRKKGANQWEVQIICDNYIKMILRRGCSTMVEHILSMCETPGSNPDTEKRGVRVGRDRQRDIDWFY